VPILRRCSSGRPRCLCSRPSMHTECPANQRGDLRGPILTRWSSQRLNNFMITGRLGKNTALPGEIGDTGGRIFFCLRRVKDLPPGIDIVPVLLAERRRIRVTSAPSHQQSTHPCPRACGVCSSPQLAECTGCETSLGRGPNHAPLEGCEDPVVDASAAAQAQTASPRSTSRPASRADLSR
jgi:hypothetical protein